MTSPFAAESLSDPAGLVVLTDPDDTIPGTAALAALASLPCVVIATAAPNGGVSPLADTAPEAGVASLEDLLARIEEHPVAATSLALLMRQGISTLGAALVAESATFSLLQSGPEFTRWRAGRTAGRIEPEGRAGVLIERHGDNLAIVLNRPEVKNALNRAVRDGLLEGLTLAGADPSIATVELRGNGSNFSSGGDLNEFGTFADPASAHLIRLNASIGRAIDALGERVVAHVHGPCAGSGVELAAFASRVVADHSFTAMLPEVSLGLVPGAGGTFSITARIGRHRSTLLGLSGAPIDASTALSWGLVDELVGP